MTQREVAGKRPLVVSCADPRITTGLIHKVSKESTGSDLPPYVISIFGGGLIFGEWKNKRLCVERYGIISQIRRAVDNFNIGYISLTTHNKWCKEAESLGIYPENMTRKNITHSCHPGLEKKHLMSHLGEIAISLAVENDWLLGRLKFGYIEL